MTTLVELNVYEFTEWTFYIRLMYPQSQFSDLQFILDVITTTNYPNSSTSFHGDTYHHPSSSSSSSLDTESLSLFNAEFQSSSHGNKKSKVGCKNTRVYGRGRDHELFTLHISMNIQEWKDKQQQQQLNGNMSYGGGNNAIHVVGAWATGHEAVTLTPDILIIPKDISSLESKYSGIDDRIHQDEKKKIHIPMDTLNHRHHHNHADSIQQQVEEAAAKERQRVRQSDEQGIHPKGRFVVKGEEDEDEDSNPLLQFLHIPTFRTRYSHNSLGIKYFSIHGYEYGILLFILTGIMTWGIYYYHHHHHHVSQRGSIKPVDDVDLETWKER